MQNSNAPPIVHASQSNPNRLPTLNMGIYEGMCLLMFTLLYMCMVSSQIPHGFWCQIEVKCPYFPLHSLRGRGGGGGSGA